MKPVIWSALLFAATAAGALEPTDELQLSAEAGTARVESRVGSEPSSGTVDLKVGLTAPAGAVTSKRGGAFASRASSVVMGFGFGSWSSDFPGDEPSGYGGIFF